MTGRGTALGDTRLTRTPGGALTGERTEVEEAAVDAREAPDAWRPAYTVADSMDLDELPTAGSSPTAQ